MWIVWLALTIPFACFLLQFILHWTIYRNRQPRSILISTLRGCILVSVVYAAAAGLIMGGHDAATIATHVVFMGSCAVCISYCYFILFMMSETARRIRILVTAYDSQKEGKDLSLADFGAYGADAMIKVRLDRLLGTGAIRLQDGKYVACPGPMLFAGRTLRLWRSLIYK